MGISESQFHSFVSEIYNQCRYYDVSPTDLVKTSSQVLAQLSSTPLSDLPHYIEAKLQEKDQLEHEIVSTVNREETIKAQMYQLLSDLHTIQDSFEEFTSARNELQNYGIDVSEIHKLVTATGMKKIIDSTVSKLQPNCPK